MSGIRKLQKEVHRLAVDKGWHEKPLITNGVPDVDRIAAKVALMHSELSEALEELRKPPILGSSVALEAWYGHGDKPEGFAIELADLVIRVLDTCEALGLDLQEAIEEKHAYNTSRPYSHGNKAL